MKLRTIAFLIALLLLSLLVIDLSIKSIVPSWAVKAREDIAIRTVELFWKKGVRLVWEGGYRENLDPYGLSVKIKIPVPSSPNQICVEISYRR